MHCTGECSLSSNTVQQQCIRSLLCNKENWSGEFFFFYLVCSFIFLQELQEFFVSPKVRLLFRESVKGLCVCA